MQRPGLQALLADVDGGLIDVIVVYKVDRLTRSLTDFARIVDVLDKKGASFVSVTQQFNTTSSMGRLTLNVLLSFAQFEREVTGERIRDKVAASKKKGMWMGGFPPLGYNILNRKLAVNEGEVVVLRAIFARFLELGSVRLLTADLRQRKIVSKRWKTRKGELRGGHPLSRGALYYLLRNRIYLGEIEHRGQIHKGEHPAIISHDLWRKVQARLDGDRPKKAQPRRPAQSAHLLAGLIFDDRGNRMSPSHVKKRNGQRYRYYVSQAVLQHRPDAAGSLARIAAPAVEELVIDRVHRLSGPARMPATTNEEPGARQSLVRSLVRRVTVARDRVVLTIDRARLPKKMSDVRQRLADGDRIEQDGPSLRVDLRVRLNRWGGETVIEGPNGGPAVSATHVDRSLMNSIARAVEWRDALTSGAAASFKAIARKSGCTEGYVRQLVELAFLAPDIVTSIVRGTQPRHISVDRLVRQALPLSWHEQRRVLGVRT